MAAEALKLMGDLKTAMDALGLQLSDASTALQDEKTASYAEGVVAGKAEVGQADPAAKIYSQDEFDKGVVEAKQAGVDAKVAELQPQIDELKKKVDELQADDDLKTAIIAKIDAMLHPAPAAPVEPQV